MQKTPLSIAYSLSTCLPIPLFRPYWFKIWRKLSSYLRWVILASDMNNLLTLYCRYAEKVDRKVLLCDAMMLYALTSALIVCLYLLLVGSYPFNSFLASVFCCLGVFTFTASLRLHSTSDDFKHISKERAYADFALCCLVSFFIVFSFIGWYLSIAVVIR